MSVRLLAAVLAASLVTLPTVAAAQAPPPKAVPAGGERPGSKPFDGLKLRALGPALMSGRIADIAIDPTDPSTWYVAVGSGGVWKTVNGGTTDPVEAIREQHASDRFAMQTALMPYEHLLPEVLRGRNERIDERF